MAAMAVADAGGRCWRRRRTRRGRQRWAAAMWTADADGVVEGKAEKRGGWRWWRRREWRRWWRRRGSEAATAATAQCLRPAPPSSELSPPGQLHIVVHVEVHEPRVRTVCRGMTVCARCYLMFVYLNRSFLILFEHTNTDRAVTCALSRAKSEKKRGGACARLSDFYVRWSRCGVSRATRRWL